MISLSDRLVMYLLGVASIFIILFGIRASADIINPILLATVITITVLPVPSKLTKKGMPGWLALVVTIGMVVLVLGLVIATVFFSITRISTEVPSYTASASQQYSNDMAAMTGTTAPQTTTTSTTEVSIQSGALPGGLLESVFDLLVQFGFALAIFFFMISAAIALPTPSRLGLDPNNPIVERVTSLTDDVRKYMTVLTGVNLMVGVGNTIFLWILGVNYALLWGLLAWFMGYIPSIGFMIALIPPVLLAYAQYGLQTALVVLVGYIIINGGVQNFIQPKIMGQSLKISPVVVFVGLFVWGYLLGGIGAILAVPMTMLVLIILENFEGTRLLAVLMRYTGETKDKESEEAVNQVKNLWNRVKETVTPDKNPKDQTK